MTRREWLWLLGAGGLAGCGSPDAAAFPSHEIKLIVQAAPGGISDTVSRVIGSLAEKALGKPVVCENRPGASGALAFSYLARRPANGYWLGHAPVEIATVRTLGYSELGPADFDLLCLVSRTEACLAVREESPWSSFAQFIDAVRNQPEYYIVGNSGTGSIWHINALLMEQAKDLRMVHLPFPGSSGAVTAALGGHIDAVVAGVGEVVSQVKAGRMRALCVFGESGSSLFPDTPTSKETGDAFGTPAWSGFFAPKGLEESRRTVLVEALRDAWESPAFRKVCQERGLEPEFLGPKEFAEFATAQEQFFRTQLASLLSLPA